MDRDIAPLAKRLAEENNVDWRSLEGSGSDGRIVERDVLDYLARVMAGEADVDPTPEPVPEGMDAWPDADRDAAPARAPAPDPAPASAATDDEDDGLLLAGDDLAEGERSDATSGREAPFGAGSTRDDAAPAEPSGTPERSDDALGSDGGLWQDHEAHPPVDADADGAPDLFLEEDAGLGASGGERPESGSEASGDAFDFGGMPGAEPPTREPSSDEPVRDEPVRDEPVRDEPPASPEAEDDDLAFDLGAAEPDDPALRDDLSDLEATDTGVRPPEEATPPREVEPAAPSADATPVAPAAPDARVAPAADAARTAGVHAAQLLRRRLNADGLLAVLDAAEDEATDGEAAVTASGPAAGGVPVVPGDVVYRAARAAAPRLGAATVDLVTVDEDGVVTTARPESLDLARIALARTDATSRPSDREPGSDELWVVDLSEYGLDEGRLAEGPLQLVVGRIVDDEDGAHCWLSLAGSVPPERGAAFLDRVAELVEDPLRLLA